MSKLESRCVMHEHIGRLRYDVLKEVRRGRRLVQLCKPFVYSLEDDGFILNVVVPAGFISDLASIPRILWPLLPADGVYQEAAIVHDWMYSKCFSRWLSDGVFRYVMEATKVPYWKRCILFWGVRMGGWMFKQERKLECGQKDSTLFKR